MKEYYISYGNVEGRIIKADDDIEIVVQTIGANQDEWLGFVGYSDRMFYVKASEIYSVEPV
jgi:hypothetical protein